MSGYRSLKRVLGESNLERKCRWLFGVCVGGLIILAFFSVGRIAENLIDDTAQYKGRGVARVYLYYVHWTRFTNPEIKTELDKKNLAAQLKLQEDLVRKFDREELQTRIIRTEDSHEPPRAGTLLEAPEGDVERAILRSLRQEAEERIRQGVQQGQPAGGEATPSAAAAFLESQQSRPLSRGFARPQEGKYVYYEVIDWTPFCMTCHEGMHGSFAESAATSASYAGSVFDPFTTPFRVIRVTMPYAPLRTAINRTRAILWSVGISTVFLAMVGLYYVVKYVVIKPLAHLRDVSDAVAKGDLAQRADIHTNDEFEELAASYNKMLRHLVESQADLREANTELDGKVDELARLNMQLHEMNRLKGEFLATMSHELRTPLNSIIGFSEVLQSLEALNDKQKRYAQNIQVSGRKLLEMINDILDLAKMEAGKMEVRLSEFRIEAVIAQQLDLVGSLADEKNIDLRAEIDRDLPLLYQDQAKVQQILTNLLSNAIKFTPEGGRITVGARGDPRGRIELWVSDTGVGIPDSEKEIIFEKFRQGQSVLGGDNLTREYSGTGLGLSIVKELCKLLGGEVTLESELGKGSTFRVVIPWLRTDTAAAAAKIAARLDDVARPRRLENVLGEPAPAEVAAAHSP